MAGRNYYQTGVDRSVDWYRRIAELVHDTVTFYLPDPRASTEHRDRTGCAGARSQSQAGHPLLL
jgi:hypothetical protein